MTNHKPARKKLPILTQLCKLIPSHLTASLAKKHGIDKQARTFSAWSHVVSMLFAQLTHATTPPRNTLSHANKTRDSKIMEELFWKTLHHFENSLTGVFGLRYKGVPRRFKATCRGLLQTNLYTTRFLCLENAVVDSPTTQF